MQVANHGILETAVIIKIYTLHYTLDYFIDLSHRDNTKHLSTRSHNRRLRRQLTTSKRMYRSSLRRNVVQGISASKLEQRSSLLPIARERTLTLRSSCSLKPGIKTSFGYGVSPPPYPLTAIPFRRQFSPQPKNFDPIKHRARLRRLVYVDRRCRGFRSRSCESI